MITAFVTVFSQGLSRSTAAAIEELVSTFGGNVLSDRFSAFNHQPNKHLQLCWAHLILNLIARRQLCYARAYVFDTRQFNGCCRTPGRQR
jgi:hypothetical protein